MVGMLLSCRLAALALALLPTEAAVAGGGWLVIVMNPRQKQRQRQRTTNCGWTRPSQIGNAFPEETRKVLAQHCYLKPVTCLYTKICYRGNKRSDARWGRKDRPLHLNAVMLPEPPPWHAAGSIKERHQTETERWQLSSNKAHMVLLPCSPTPRLTPGIWPNVKLKAGSPSTSMGLSLAPPTTPYPCGQAHNRNKSVIHFPCESHFCLKHSIAKRP